MAHKLTRIKGTEFTARYINRFHDIGGGGLKKVAGLPLRPPPSFSLRKTPNKKFRRGRRVAPSVFR